jgi:tetratricopeptide (TPR) repeat protein
VARPEAVEPTDVSAVLERLVSQNLVRSEDSEGGRRFRFLETIREYAAERLEAAGESAETAERHTAFVKGLVEEFHTHWHDNEQIAWLGRIGADHDNIRAALQRVIDEGDGAQGLEIANAVGWFWKVRGLFTEGRAWIDRCLDSGDTIEPRARAIALNHVGVLSNDNGRPDEAIDALRRAIEIGRSLGGERIVGVAHVNLANAHILLGDPIAAEQAYTDALNQFREIDDRPGRSAALTGLGELARARGDHVAAETLYLESLELDRRFGDDHSAAETLHNLGQLALAQHLWDRARGHFLESLDLMRSSEDSQGIALALDGLAALALARSDVTTATRLHAAAAAVRRAADVPLLQPERDQIASSIEACRERLSPGAFEAAWDSGQGLDLDAAQGIAEVMGSRMDVSGNGS